MKKSPLKKTREADQIKHNTYDKETLSIKKEENVKGKKNEKDEPDNKKKKSRDSTEKPTTLHIKKTMETDTAINMSIDIVSRHYHNNVEYKMNRREKRLLSYFKDDNEKL